MRKREMLIDTDPQGFRGMVRRMLGPLIRFAFMPKFVKAEITVLPQGAHIMAIFDEKEVVSIFDRQRTRFDALSKGTKRAHDTCDDLERQGRRVTRIEVLVSPTDEGWQAYVSVWHADPVEKEAGDEAMGSQS